MGSCLVFVRSFGAVSDLFTFIKYFERFHCMECFGTLPLHEMSYHIQFTKVSGQVDMVLEYLNAPQVSARIEERLDFWT